MTAHAKRLMKNTEKKKLRAVGPGAVLRNYQPVSISKAESGNLVVIPSTRAPSKRDSEKER